MSGNRLKKIWLPVLIILGILFLCGCDKKEADVKSDPENGVYCIYYKNTDGTELVPAKFETDIDKGNTMELVEVLLKELQSQKEDNPYIVPAVPTNMPILEYDLSLLPFLTLNFGKTYNAQNSSDEILCRAALVMTLTQIEAVDYLEIQVEGQPLMDSSNTLVGKLSVDNFFTDDKRAAATHEKNTLYLYFASEDGKNLVEVERTVLNDSSLPTEKLVMKLLIEGPPDDSAKAILPENVSILAISIKAGTCYVNFDSTFLTEIVDLDPNIIIYGIVNSLTELPDITQVQIMVDGSSKIKFKDVVSLEAPLSANLDYVVQPEPETTEDITLE